jgi:hypothetical protein
MTIEVSTNRGCKIYTVTDDTVKENSIGKKAVEITGTYTSVEERLPGGSIAIRTPTTSDEAYFSEVGNSDFVVAGGPCEIRVYPLQTQVTNAKENINNF